MRVVLRAGILATTLTLLAPSGTGRAAPTSTPTTTRTTDEQDAPAQAAAQLLARARGLVAKTSELRGLRRRRRVAMGVMTRPQIVEQLEKRLATDYSDEEIAIDEAVLKQLGLLPATITLKDALLELLADQVAGFYDPLERKLNIAAWLPVELQTAALVHEICHALQDQHFRLKRFVKPLKDNSDQQYARMALVEGDCTGVMIEHALAPQGRDLGSLTNVIDKVVQGVVGGQSSGKFRAAPKFLRETLTFPYVAGLRFVQRIRRLNSWKQVNRVFRRLPQSTEQMLHYEKYWQRDRPLRVKIGALPALAGYRVVKRDTLGEFQLRLLAEIALGPEAAARATDGWGGDRLFAYRRKDQPTGEPPLLVHLSAWDSTADAVEFSNALRRVATKRTGRAADNAGPDSWVWQDAGETLLSVQRAGEAVLLLVGVPAALSVQLQAQAWKGARVNGRAPRLPATRAAQGAVR